MKNILLAIATLLLLQNCSTMNHIAIQWKYRNDYKLAMPNKIQTADQAVVATTQKIIILKTEKKLINIELDTLQKTLTSSKSNRLDKVGVMDNYKNKTKKFKTPIVAAIAIDTPPPNKYYNNYYENTSEKRIERHAKRGYMFGFLSFIPYGGLVLSFFAIINGAIGLYKINEEPDKYRGRGFAIAGIGMGVLVLSLYALLIFLILMSINGNGNGFI